MKTPSKQQKLRWLNAAIAIASELDYVGPTCMIMHKVGRFDAQDWYNRASTSFGGTLDSDYLHCCDFRTLGFQTDDGDAIASERRLLWFHMLRRYVIEGIV